MDGLFEMSYSSRVNRICVLLVFSTIGMGPTARAGAESRVSFNEQIRPLLNARCIKCHGGVKEAGGMNFLFRESALKGGKSGLPAIVPGKPEESELIKRVITADEDDRMPKKGE